MAGLCLILSGAALALTWLYERITTAPIVEDRQGGRRMYDCPVCGSGGFGDCVCTGEVAS